MARQKRTGRVVVAFGSVPVQRYGLRTVVRADALLLPAVASGVVLRVVTRTAIAPARRPTTVTVSRTLE